MNLRWYERALFALSGLLLMCVGAFFALVCSGLLFVDWPLLEQWMDGWRWLPATAVACVVFVWGAWLLIRPLLRKGEASGRYYTLQDQEAGEVHISVQALDHLVHKALSVWPEILNAQVRIGGQESAMRITLRATLQSNVRIPELIGDVRAEIKQYVEECAGVKVESVKVIIVSTKDTKPGESLLLPAKGHTRGRVEPERMFIAREPESFVKPDEIFEQRPEPVAVEQPVADVEPEPVSEPEPQTMDTETDETPDEPATETEEETRDA